MSTCRIALSSTFWTTRGTPTFATQVLSSASHKLAFAFIAQGSATINALGIRPNTITGSSPTYQVELQGLDASGIPDGIALAGSSTTFNPTALGWPAGSFQWLSIPGAAITRGTPYALVVRHASGTIDAGNNTTFSLAQNTVAPDSITLPYYLTDTGGGYTKNSASGDLVFGYRSSTLTYGSPIQSWITGSLGTNGHRAALKLALDAGWGSTYKVRGLLGHAMQSGGPAGAFKFGIWNASGAELASVTIDSDHAGGNAIRQLRGSFTSIPTLSFGTTYYFGIERVSTVNQSPRYIEVSNNRDLEAYPFGPAAILSTWDGSTWTDNNTQLFPISLLMEDWTKPASGNHVSIIMG